MVELPQISILMQSPWPLRLGSFGGQLVDIALFVKEGLAVRGHVYGYICSHGDYATSELHSGRGASKAWNISQKFEPSSHLVKFCHVGFSLRGWLCLQGSVGPPNSCTPNLVLCLPWAL